MATDPYLRKTSIMLVAVLTVSLALCLPPKIGYTYELLIGTEKPGSFSWFAGKTVCRAIARSEDNLSCRPVPADNYTDSLTNLLSGSLDLALVNSKTIFDAFHQAGHFRYITMQYDQLRLLMPLYRTPAVMLVRKDSKIDSLATIKKKSVNAGAPFSLEELVFREIMLVNNWQEKSFRPLQNLSTVNAQDYLALHSGSTQAMLHIGMHPDRNVERSLTTGHTKLIAIAGGSIDRLAGSNSGFSRQTIPAGSYPGQSAAIETLAIENMLVTSADTDEVTVTRILQAIHTAEKQMQYAHPALLDVKIDIEALINSYLHPHPAAVLFFQMNR